MKLRNKKTGEIVERVDIAIRKVGVVFNNDETYDSLADLNGEWEDVPEEPKDFWYIDLDGEIQSDGGVYEDNTIKGMKMIGNYFSTREEAEQTVEKLKAWKLLKDEMGIRFDGVIRDDRARLKGVKVVYDRHQVTFDRMRECMDALHLLFGGEE